MRIELTEEAKAVTRRLEGFPPVMRKAIAAAMDLQNEGSIGHIVQTKLTSAGPQFLNVRTGRLRRSARRNRAEVDGDTITSSIGSNVKYAGVHEYGFQGTQKVDGFVRRNPRGDVRATGPRGGRKIIARGVSFVRPHTRRVNFPERAMFRTGIEERLPKYGTAISTAIVEAWENPS